MRRSDAFLLPLLTGTLLAWAGGCDRSATRLMSAERIDRGLTLVLPGIEGRGHLNRNIRNGLADGGVPTAIRIHDWTLGPMMVLANQTLETRARRKGEELAREICRYRVLRPGRPVFLVAHSGGGAVALFAAEALPPDASVDTIILLGPSISPEYDLTGALARVDNRIINYYSPLDRAFLGVGTWVFGTLDGRHSSSAGRVGFTRPPERLKQITWDESMRLSGNEGGHTDWADRRFVRDYVAPQLTRRIR